MKAFALLMCMTEYYQEECQDPDIADNIYCVEDAAFVIVKGEHDKFEDNCVELHIGEDELTAFKEADGTLYIFEDWYSREDMTKAFDRVEKVD